MFLLLLPVLLAAAIPAPETAIRKVIDNQQAAWNRGDVRAFMEGYARRDDVVFVGKAVTRGWQAVLDRYLQAYSSAAQMGRLRFSQIEVRQLGPAHALVLGRFDLERTGAGGGNTGGWFTLIFEKTKEGWRIIADHTS
jgi:uncharacterized protein (TIGR02246 family)